MMKVEIGRNTLIWAEDESGNLIGIQGLIIDGVAQMTESFPSRFIFQSPAGCDYRKFLPIEAINNDDSLIIKTKAIGSTCDTSWYRDQYDNDILQVRRPSTPPPVYINFIIKPVKVTHGKLNFQGIHIDWQFSSKSASLGSLRWEQHWEVEGNCEGTTVYWQSQNAPVEDCLRWFKDTLEIFKEYNISWSVWSYKDNNFPLADSNGDVCTPELLKLLKKNLKI